MKKRDTNRGHFIKATPSPDRECFYCGKPLSVGNMTVDHVIPVSAGGVQHMNNKVAACLECNQAKGDRLPTNEELERLERLIWLRKRVFVFKTARVLHG